MKVSNFKRLTTEDVDKEFRPLMDKLAFSINPFAEEVIKALDGNLSIPDNFNQQEREITVTVDSDGVPTSLTQFKTNLPNNCKGTQVIRATNLTNSSVFPTGYPFMSYTELNGVLTINHITGLPANNKFNIRFIIFP